MCIVFVCMRYVKKFGCHYNQSGVLKIEILILLRLARFQNLGTPPNNRCTGCRSSAIVRASVIVCSLVVVYGLSDVYADQCLQH